jgi:hypothetical protein
MKFTYIALLATGYVLCHTPPNSQLILSSAIAAPIIERQLPSGAPAVPKPSPTAVVPGVPGVPAIPSLPGFPGVRTSSLHLI